MTDSMIPEVWQPPEGGVVWVRVDPYDSLPYRVVRPDGTVAWAGGVPVDAAVRMVPETIAEPQALSTMTADQLADDVITNGDGSEDWVHWHYRNEANAALAALEAMEAEQ